MSELKNLRELFSKAHITRVISVDDCHNKELEEDELKQFLGKVDSWQVEPISLPNVPSKKEREKFLTSTQKGKTLWLVDNEMYGDSDAGENLIIELITRTAYTDNACRNIYALTSRNVENNQIGAFRQRVSEALGKPEDTKTLPSSAGKRSPFPDGKDYAQDFQKLTNPDALEDETSKTSTARISDSVETENQSQSQRSLSFFACIVEKRLLTGDLSAIAQTEAALCEQIVRGVLDNHSAPLLRHLSGIYSAAADTAKKSVLSFGPDTIYRIFFESGKDEGIMPTDVIQRFLMSLLRKNLSEQIAKGYDDIAERIDAYRKAVEAMPPIFKNEDDYAPVLEARVAECYDTSVNGRYLPALSGDIFQIGSDESPQYYLLLGQACNLTVRDKGGRTAQCATLAEITKESKTEGKSDSRPEPLNYFWNVIGGKKDVEWRVDFNQTINVDFNALDLCALNVDGAAKANLNEAGNLDSPIRYPRSIRKRLQEAVAHNWRQAQQYQTQCEAFKQLKDAYESKGSNIAEIPSNIELDFSKIAASVREIYSDNSLNVVPDFKDGGVTYNIRRLARLSEAYTDKILREYANYHSRKAVDFDFAKSYQTVCYTVEYVKQKVKGAKGNGNEPTFTEEFATKFPALANYMEKFLFSPFVYYQNSDSQRVDVQNGFLLKFKERLPSESMIFNLSQPTIKDHVIQVMMSHLPVTVVCYDKAYSERCGGIQISNHKLLFLIPLPCLETFAEGKLKNDKSTDGLSEVTVNRKGDFATFSFPVEQREWTFDNPQIFKGKIRFTVAPDGDKCPILNLDFLEID